MRKHWTARAAMVLVALTISTACGSTYAQGRRPYPNYPNYPDSRGGARRVYQDPAYTRGYEDGYRRGVDAVRDSDRYDVRRERLYRSADNGYDRRYGSRNDWRQGYRNGFETGYDRGYREGRGRYRR